MTLNQWVAAVDERFHGRKLASRLPSLERTMRNLKSGRYASSRLTPERLARAVIEDFGGDRSDEAFTTKLRECALAAVEAPGLITALFMSDPRVVREKSEMLRLAHEVDQLSAAIVEALGRQWPAPERGSMGHERVGPCFGAPGWACRSAA